MLPIFVTLGVCCSLSGSRFCCAPRSAHRLAILSRKSPHQSHTSATPDVQFPHPHLFVALFRRLLAQRLLRLVLPALAPNNQLFTPIRLPHMTQHGAVATVLQDWACKTHVPSRSCSHRPRQAPSGALLQPDGSECVPVVAAAPAATATAVTVDCVAGVGAQRS